LSAFVSAGGVILKEVFKRLLGGFDLPKLITVGESEIFRFFVFRQKGEQWRSPAKTGRAIAGILKQLNHFLRGPERQNSIPFPVIVAYFIGRLRLANIRSKSIRQQMYLFWIFSQIRRDLLKYVPFSRIDFCGVHKRLPFGRNIPSSSNTQSYDFAIPII
jgi:hypothetical protein